MESLWDSRQPRSGLLFAKADTLLRRLLFSAVVISAPLNRSMKLMSNPESFWNAMFGASSDQTPGIPLGMRLLRKRGRPLLLLPCHAAAAVACLDLYPAQSGRARMARALLRALLKIGLPFGTEKIEVSVSAESPLVKFLCPLGQGLGSGTRLRDEAATGQAPAATLPGIPTLGILAGNPANDTQRFLVLIFDAQQKPIAVVKTGLS